jgi:hypothetical protein
MRKRAPVAQAKLAPEFSERSVKPGEVARLDLGEGAEQFLAPLKVYLVPLGIADRARAQSDPRLTIGQAADTAQIQATGAGGSVRSGDGGTFFWWAPGFGSAALVAGLVLWRWRRNGQAERVV